MIVLLTFDSHISEEKDCAEPSDGRAESFSCAGTLSSLRFILVSMLSPIDRASHLPESNRQTSQLNDCYTELPHQLAIQIMECGSAPTHHQIIERVPRQPALDDHGRRNQRREQGS